MPKRTLQLSVIVPVFNSEGSLKELAARLSRILPTVASSYELILVNDASGDASWEIVRELAQTHHWIHGVNLMRNYGQHNAILCGVREAKYPLVLTMDDDLQHPPEEIPKLLGRLAEGFDVVYGSPQTERHGLWRDIASQLTKYSLRSAMGVDIAREVSAFRAFKTKLREAFQDYKSPYVCIDVLLSWGTTRFGSVRVRHEPRTIGQSNYNFRKLVVHALNMTTGYSTAPLQFASVTGFAFTFFGICVLAYVVARYLLMGGSVPGFPFLASIIAIFSGAQLFAVGIIGEYLARMHFRSMDRPAYATRTHTAELQDDGVSPETVESEDRKLAVTV